MLTCTYTSRYVIFTHAESRREWSFKFVIHLDKVTNVVPILILFSQIKWCMCTISCVYSTKFVFSIKVDLIIIIIIFAAVFINCARDRGERWNREITDSDGEKEGFEGPYKQWPIQVERLRTYISYFSYFFNIYVYTVMILLSFYQQIMKH